jgi:integrase
VVKLLVWTGARSGEALGAKWNEFDLESGLWERPAHRNKQGEATTTPLGPIVVAMLREMQSRTKSEYLFPSPRNLGAPLDGIKTYWLALRKRADLPNLRVHDLRHVYAQALLDSNVPFDTIAQLLGHSTTAMTKRYAHRSSEALRRAAASVARALAPPAISGSCQIPEIFDDIEGKC